MLPIKDAYNSFSWKGGKISGEIGKWIILHTLLSWHLKFYPYQFTSLAQTYVILGEENVNISWTLNIIKHLYLHIWPFSEIDFESKEEEDLNQSWERCN